jgi:hypothetical protein
MRNTWWATWAIVLGVAVNLILAANAGANPKISKCLKERECLFFVSGSMTEEPKMSFLVLQKVWKTMLDRDRHELREMLKKRIKQANDKPGKFVHEPKKAPNYETQKRNIQNMRSYSVFLSYGKDRKGGLQLDQEIMVNF